MDRLILLLRDSGDTNFGGADSFSDRLNNKYTVSILIIFALLTTTRQYVSEPISCWCPNHFTSSQVDYVNKVCWTTSTYYLADSIREIPSDQDITDKISYYQWIPLVAVGQAFMFLVPKILWTLLSKKSGFAINSITDAAAERHKKSDQVSADKIMHFMVKTLGKFLKELSWDSCYKKDETDKKKKRFGFMCRAKVFVVFYGNYLTFLYVIIKIVYILNVILQIILLNVFLQTNYGMYGLETMSRMVKGEDWTTSHRFPRIALCNFYLRVMGENQHRNTVQCALPINLIHEIFYIFLWFWFVFLVVVTGWSCLSWCIMCFPKSNRVRFVRNKLYADGQLRRNPDDETERYFKLFVLSYLRRDGCFIARLIARNTTDVIAADLLAGLWKDFVIKTRRYEGEKGKLLIEDCLSPTAFQDPPKPSTLFQESSDPFTNNNFKSTPEKKALIHRGFSNSATTKLNHERS